MARARSLRGPAAACRRLPQRRAVSRCRRARSGPRLLGDGDRAYDIVDGGASSVWLAVRTPPNLVLRSPPGDAIATVLLRLPPRMADAPMTVVRRLASGDLTEYGLPCPEEGIFARQHREGKAPAIVDREVIEAIKDRRIQIVAGVHSLDATGVLLADGWRIEPAAIIAATGYRRDLERMVATSACSTIGA